MAQALAALKSKIRRLTLAPDLLGNAGRLGSGTAIGQLITLLAAPLLTRLYSPDDFGVFGTFTAITTMFAVIACLNFEQALLIAADNLEVEALTGLCIFVIFAIMSASTIGLLVGAGPVIRTVGPNIYEVLLWAGPFSLLAAGLFSLSRFLLFRINQFSPLAHYLVSRSLIGVIAQTGAWVWSLGALGLVLGQLAGQLLGLAGPMRKVGPTLATSTARVLKEPMSAVRAAIRYRQFALFGAPQTMLNMLTQGLPVILLTFYFHHAEAGFFWLAYRLLGVPSQVLSESLRGSLYQHFSQLHLAGKSLVKPILKGGMTIGMALALPAALLAIFGPLLFSVAFGPAWHEAGVYTQLLTFAWLLQDMSIPAAAAIVILERQRAYLGLEVLATAARLIGFIVGAHLGDPRLAIFFYSLASAGHAMVISVYTLASARLVAARSDTL